MSYRITMIGIIAGLSLMLCVTQLRADAIDVQINATSLHGITSTYWHGQTFTPTQNFLTAVELSTFGPDHPFHAGLTNGAQITVEVYEANGFSGININLGSLLGSATKTLPLGTGSEEQWSGRFELGAIDVSSYLGNAADNAVVALFSTEAGWTGELTVRIEGDAYADGTAVQSIGGGAWNSDQLGPTIDLGFRSYGDSVPEPTSIALLVGSGILMMVHRRRI